MQFPETHPRNLTHQKRRALGEIPWWVTRLIRPGRGRGSERQCGGGDGNQFAQRTRPRGGNSDPNCGRRGEGRGLTGWGDRGLWRGGCAAAPALR
ncbi:hypothetical protein M758_5G032400 [Ceratodon purpureus]|nr:hypothetical protein M758_5G032400 [Ceratodon purpureus]